jgi:Acetyltransferase (GNAT) domain
VVGPWIEKAQKLKPSRSNDCPRTFAPPRRNLCFCCLGRSNLKYNSLIKLCPGAPAGFPYPLPCSTRLLMEKTSVFMRAQAVEFNSPDQLVTIEKLNDANLAEWDEFVGHHKWGLVGHLSGWKRAIEETFPHIKGQILALRSGSGKLVAGIPIYRVKSSFLGNRTVSIPFATLCDPLVNSGNQMKTLVTHLSGSHSGSMRISTWRAAETLGLEDKTYDTGFLHHFLTLDSPFEELTRQFSKTAVRQMVVRAQRSGVDVEAYGGDIGLKTFYDLYCLTRHRLGLPSMPFRFFDSLYRHLGSDRVLLLHARRGTQVLGSILAFKWKEMIAVECMGEGPEARKLGVNQLLWWEAIRLACEQGYRLFSFGRTHQSNKGLVDFKRRWGTQQELLPVFVHPAPSRRIVYTAEGMVTRFLRRLTSAAPDALYFRFSAACYRHLG